MSRRGLTLVEVLASTVLLAMIVAVCLPLFQAAMHAVPRPMEQSKSAFDVTDLAEIADFFMTDPATLGAVVDGDAAQREVPWPEHPERPPVRMWRLTAAEADHAWLAFSCGPWRVHRWSKVEELATEVQGVQP